MYPYTKEIDLAQAEALDRIAFKNGIEILAQNRQYQLNPVNICMWDFGDVYTKDKRTLSITALDYATHILNQAAPPEGWGYAAYELDSGRYDSIAYCKFKNEFKEWETSLFKNDWRLEKRPFYEVCFHLTDLARVEASSEKEIAEPPIQPSEIKDETQNYDWEAKYKELQEQSRQIKEEVYDLTDRLLDAQNCIAELEEKLKTAKHYAANLSDKLGEAEETLKKYGTRSEVYIRAMEHKLTLLDQLKQADIEIAKASFDYYPKF